MMMNSVKAQIGQDLLAAPKRLPHFAAAALASSFLGQKIYNQNLRRPPLSKQVFGDGGILSPQQKQQNCVGLLLKNYYCVSVGNFHEKQQRRQQQSCALAESEIPVERECVDVKGIIRSEFPSVPVQSEPVTDTLQAAILRHHQQDPNQLAFICAENPADRITYGDFLRQCHFVADFLAAMDFGKGDCVGVVTRNSWQFFAAFMAAAMRGGCITGANAQLTNAEIARQFEIAKCRMVFCEESLLEKMCDVKNICPGIEHLVLIPSKFPHEPLANLPPNIHNWAELEQARPSNGSVFGIKRAPYDIKIARDLAFLPFSSGTTGPGKGVMLSHKSVGTMLRILNSHFTERVVQRMDPDWDWKRENSMMILPFYHIYGFMNGLNNLLNGGTGILFRKFDLELFCRVVQDYKIKQVSLVPPILVYLAKCPQLTAQYDLSSLRMIMTGAAPLGEDLCREVKRQIPSIEQISQGYGMTEQSMCSHMPVFGWQNHRAAGRLNPNFEMKIVDVQTREPVPLGQLGEICTRSPTNMRGYLNNPEATAETIDEDGWLRTGDIGYCDEQGWTYVVDRLKELIKVKGLQVAPAELEDTLLAHPSIADCAVVGVPDEMCGEVPKAFVVRAANAPSLNEEEVKQFMKDRVAAYKQLKYVQFVDAIPKSPAGKILRRSLRA